MSSDEQGMVLDQHQSTQRAGTDEEGGAGVKAAEDLEAVFDVPVQLAAVLGHTKMKVSDLLHLDTGIVMELDRKVGEAIDVYVNNRLIARGEVVLVEDKLGVTMTEIIKADK
ncbi:flagellar motor switch protein FliN/FliY [Pseudovibrio denitrificans]|uniref:Flagellar motor switch protein FliN n=2 Tax=Pseudovibrio TaxID=258255 RepID=A0A1I6Z7J2_9HYPH|nr:MULTISPECIES: flagellar motor switch protein FliN [Pseudovibrio]QUS55047.1 flagellar motor switch protein FliN [Pseudovibrio brasiliensis]SFT58633.1 flagellar motor switch protein FliN/FliY [Pseudovibrio denitrificans]